MHHHSICRVVTARRISLTSRGALVLGVLREDIAGGLALVIDAATGVAGGAPLVSSSTAMMPPPPMLGAASGNCGLTGAVARTDPDATAVSALPGEAALNSASVAVVAAPANSTCAIRTCLRRASAVLITCPLELDGLFVMHHI
jgi:hypothetical protein